MSITKKLISIGENGYAMQTKKFSKSHILVVYVSHAFTRKVFILNKYHDGISWRDDGILIRYHPNNSRIKWSWWLFECKQSVKTSQNGHQHNPSPTSIKLGWYRIAFVTPRSKFFTDPYYAQVILYFRWIDNAFRHKTYGAQF